MADVWFTLEDGIACGPYTETELQTRYLWGELDGSAQLWKMNKAPEGSAAPPLLARDAPFLDSPPPTWAAAVAPEHASALNKPTLGTRWAVLLIVTGAAAAFAFLACITWAPDWRREQTLFACEFAGFCGLWLVYFMSRHGSGKGFFHVATLRRLLRLTATPWAQNSKDLGEAFRLKAEKTITATAMFVATSGVVLTRIAQSYSDWETAHRGAGWCWELALFTLAALAGFSAIVCFILSVDALDAVANHFKTREITARLRGHFYMSTINPRYFGFVLLLSAIILMLACRSALLGCAALALVVGLGYRHWFPPTDVLTKKMGTPPTLGSAAAVVASFGVRLGVLLLPPILVAIFPEPNRPWIDSPSAAPASSLNAPVLPP